MIDTFVLVAALLATHEFHDVARPHLRAQTRVPAIVPAETYAQLRRTFAQPADIAGTLLRTWSGQDDRILPTGGRAVRTGFDRAVERVALALGTDSSYLLS